ncbi:hydrogenase formation protein HypD [Geobacter sp. SVR]|uniref:hydrogenase formation protein HypD n=1 Tax=Geobacter sp. SVR TaxID=2495594 RepID=UPI00143EF92E|nr:hydrogenase formation protein HypD [Geobacter sp. SVR]BCS55132.1 hydrogenase expression/formation protein [Geobacter sp. SVR]GCF85313.1 hydrogenase expression/formation protein [Geobacter sp. SVR]
MNYQDDFRDSRLVAIMAENIAGMAAQLPGPVSFMEVCGTHTMSIYQYGIRSLLPDNVRLISGPGCPVCVTPIGYVDKAVACASDSNNIVATFGDMLRVPGSRSSLMEARAQGADVRVVYSPLDAVALAKAHLDRRVVFLGVGFETTAPAIAASILDAARQGLSNYCVLASHKTVPLPMELLSCDPELGLSGYLCPAHVSTVIGGNAYRKLADTFGVPCVVTGFEPADVMQGIEMLLAQVLAGKSLVEIQYNRAVSWEGNAKAQRILDLVFEPCDAVWRGLGLLPGSGLAIRPELSAFDAEKVLTIVAGEEVENSACRCGEVLKGKLAPFDCPLFATACTPESPVGACMVSSEGTCAAAYKYGR